MRAIVLAAALLAAGCEPDLGACDRGAVRVVVYDEEGTPAYAGQALMIASCGYGGFCHSEGIDPELRYGAPAGLDFDVRLAGYDDVVDLDEVDRLRRMREQTSAHGRLIWASVSAGRMPVGGAVGRSVAESAPRYTFERTQAPLPGLETAEGREIVRNWLACGAPVVERTEAPTPTAGYRAVGDAVPGIEVEPLEPRWDDIYDRLIERRCNGAACHGERALGRLDLRGRSEALTTLLEGEARGDLCGGTRTPLLVPGRPDESLFFQKLTGRDADGAPICGRLMPIGASRLSPESLQAVRTWIERGASP